VSGAPLPVAVIDYGAGNLVSIEQALTHVGAQAWRARRTADLANAAALIVPGVGAAGPAMARLRRTGLVDPIRDWIAADRPFLGICLGLQLLFDSSDEDGARTLGILPGVSRRLVDAPTLPHIGWNQVRRRRSHPLFDGLADDADFYFVHSYAGAPAKANDDVVLAQTEHGRPFVSALARSNLLGVQFHPERSGTDGLRVLSNFVRLAGSAAARAA
jgi:imidazole glycerol phosphate synthase glutamine amidotransferase subunit